jgi:hypothetical protein
MGNHYFSNIVFAADWGNPCSQAFTGERAFEIILMPPKGEDEKPFI